MSKRSFEKQTSNILAVLGNPFRVRLALALGKQEACVCHLEKLLKKRQAYISQHLMVLREAGLLETRRDGKYIYYRLSNIEVIELIRAAAIITGIDHTDFPEYQTPTVLEKCECPNCELGKSGFSKSTSSLDSVSAS